MNQPGKLSRTDVRFFSLLSWDRELKALSYLSPNSASFFELVKGVLIKHGYKLTYDNIEYAKQSLLEFCEKNNNHIEKKSFRDFRREYTAEQLQYMPVISGQLYVTVYFS